MSKWVKANKSSLHHFTLMQPLKPGKDNTYAISQLPKSKTISSLISMNCIKTSQYQYNINILPSPSYNRDVNSEISAVFLHLILGIKHPYCCEPKEYF